MNRVWLRRTGVALLSGTLASLFCYCLALVRPGMSAKLLGDANHLALRLVDTSRPFHHSYAQVLFVNGLLYAVWTLAAFAAKDLLVTARKASPNERSRRFVTFCLIQAFGTGFLLTRIDPGDAMGAFLLLPGSFLVVLRWPDWLPGGAATGLFIILSVNALAWLAGYTVSDIYRICREEDEVERQQM